MLDTSYLDSEFAGASPAVRSLSFVVGRLARIAQSIVSRAAIFEAREGVLHIQGVVNSSG